MSNFPQRDMNAKLASLFNATFSDIQVTDAPEESGLCVCGSHLVLVTSDKEPAETETSGR